MDDTKIEGALLIGSDGIFSTVRRQLELPGDRLNYVGLCVVLGIVDDEILEIPLAKRRIFETVERDHSNIRHAVHNKVNDVSTLLPVLGRDGKNVYERCNHVEG